jgi:AmmeMemoRadiSam system protein A
VEPINPPIDEGDQRRLLAWARQAIAASLRRDRGPWIERHDLSDALARPSSAFVTLTERGELRGCIGRLDPDRPLWENVLESAVSAALEDPRFEPVRPDELDEIRLEISILEPPIEIAGPDVFDPDVHGIIVERGVHRGLLLPKVAHEYGWGRVETLRAACWKAGLSRDAWREPGTRLSVFTAFAFAEPVGGVPSGSTPRVDPAG